MTEDSTGEYLRDELAIRSLVARYSNAVCCDDISEWRTTWSQDGIWSLLGNTHEGQNAIVTHFQNVTRSLEAVIQHPHGGMISFEKNGRATGRWSMTEYARMASDGAALLTIGLYDDVYIPVNSQWLFAERAFNVLYMGPPDLSSPFQPAPSSS